MDRLSISEFSLLRWSFHQDVIEIARRGVRNIGVWQVKVDDFDPDFACDLLYEHGLNVSSYSWAGGFTGSDGRSYREAIRDARTAIRNASRLGAACLLVHPGSASGHINRHARRLLRSAMDELLPLAHDFGVHLAMEPMTGPDSRNWSIFDCVDHTIEFVSQMADPHLGLVLDLFHVGDQSQHLDRLPEWINFLKLVQLSDRRGNGADAQRCLLGRGSLPWAQWVQRIDELGYRGRYEIEVVGGADPVSYAQLLDNSIAAWQQFVGAGAKQQSKMATASRGSLPIV